MTQFTEGLDRQQTMLLPEHLDDYVDENSHVRAIDAFAEMLDSAVLGFSAQAAATGRRGLTTQAPRNNTQWVLQTKPARYLFALPKTKSNLATPAIWWADASSWRNIRKHR